jgi:ADP-heptose:LPS heptosyltransferase
MTSSAYTPPPNPGDTLRRVLVIKLGAMGDFMQALGAMRVVRATHPSARITLLTTEPYEAFAKACPYFDIVEADGRPKDLKGKADLIRRLRSAGYDMVYDFQNNDRTAQYYLGLSGKKPLWSGAAKGASHQHMNENRGEMHNFDRLAEQLLHAGLSPKPPGDPTGWIIGQDVSPSLDWIRPAFRDPPRFQPEFFSLHGPYMLLIPGSSADHPEKRWPVDRFAKIATWVADAGITPVVIGAKAEGDIGTQIMKLEPRAKSLIGRTDCSSSRPCPSVRFSRWAATPARCTLPLRPRRPASACSPRSGMTTWPGSSRASGAPRPGSAAPHRAAVQ